MSLQSVLVVNARLRILPALFYIVKILQCKNENLVTDILHRDEQTTQINMEGEITIVHLDSY